MNDRFVSIVLDESKWPTFSMAVALLAVAVLLLGERHRGSSLRRRVIAAMTLYFGVTIGTMAFGHLLAVSTKLALGTLQGSIPLLYAIGAVLAVPAFCVVTHTRHVLASDRSDRVTLALNGWLAATLLAVGIHNLPLAAPGFLVIWYQLTSRRLVGWTIVGAAVVVNFGLFIASLIFLASGRSFEQFSGN
jgi:hypothetical protein